MGCAGCRKSRIEKLREAGLVCDKCNGSGALIKNVIKGEVMLYQCDQCNGDGCFPKPKNNKKII